MPSKRRRVAPKRGRKRSGGSPLAALLTLAIAAGLAATVLVRCTHSASTTTSTSSSAAHHATEEATPAEEPSAEASPAASEETPTPEPTESPEPTPSPVKAPPAVVSPTVVPSVATAVPLPSRPVSRASGNARLAIIIDDCGQWRDTELALIALPIPITMSVLPHTAYGTEIAQAASDAGKGVMLHLPMEPMGHLNPGPGKIMTDMSDADIESTVRADLANVPLARGVNNHEGSKATSDERVMHDVASVVAQENRFFIDSRTAGTSVAEEVARDAGIPVAGRDVFLDNKADVDFSETQLLEAARIAKANGSAIAIGHPKPTTLAAIRNLIPKLEAEGITFVLAEDLVERSSASSQSHGAPASPASSGSDSGG